MKIKYKILEIIFRWIAAWLELTDGIIGIITLGFFRKSFSYYFTAWYSIHLAKKKFKNKNIRE
jgi:hypothetical protein